MCLGIYSKINGTAADDFPEEFFPLDWDMVYNKIRDGCRIQYPVSLRPAIQWSKRVYFKGEDGTLMEKSRFCSKVVHIKLNKTRCI